MKKFLVSVIAVFILAGGGLIYSNLGMANAIYPLNESVIKIYEYAEGKENELLIKIDENGHFYSEIMQGEDKGSFEAWDGEKFYRYSKEYNDLLIVINPKDDSKVIAHPLLSEVINERIAEDIANKELKKTPFSKKYKKKSKENQDIEETVEFSSEENYPQKYSMNVDDQEFLTYEIIEVKGLLENLDVQKYINLEQLKNEDVNITEIEQKE